MTTDSTRRARDDQLAFWIGMAVLVSNIDRGSIATAGPLIRDELHLSATSFGLLVSCFFWSYTAFIAPVTWLAERFGAAWMLAGCVAVWSLATGLTGVQTSFVGLLSLRLLLGAGESGVFPCASMLIAKEIPALMRGRANSLIAIGMALGPAFGTFAGGMLMANFGWRAVFIGLGAISLAWLWPWSRINSARLLPADPVGPTKVVLVPLKSLVSERAVWGTVLANACAGYTYYFMMSWMPTYLVQERGLSMSSMAQVIGGAFLLRAVMSFVGGRVIDGWIRSGRSPTTIYKVLIGANCLAACVFFAGISSASQRSFVIWMFVYEFFAGLSTTAGLGAVQTMAGPQATGSWVSLQNIAASIAGIVAPVITGVIIDQTGHYLPAFLLAGLTALLQFIGWVLIVRRVEPSPGCRTPDFRKRNRAAEPR